MPRYTVLEAGQAAARHALGDGLIKSTVVQLTAAAARRTLRLFSIKSVFDTLECIGGCVRGGDITQIKSSSS